jgi:hypothetical protein
MLKLVRAPAQAKDIYVPEKGRIGWLEVYGETEPAVSSADGTPPADGAGLYEYRWSLGYLPSLSADHSYGRLRRRGGRAGGNQHQDQLSDSAARVSLFFSADCDWRVSEILATVKHLAPVQDERTWREELAKDFTAIQPVIGVAGQVAADAAGIPQLGSVAQAVSRLKFTSVPPTQSAEWFVCKVDLVRGDYLFYGIEWHLSRNLLNQLGSRVTGGLLVSFTKVNSEGTSQAADPSQGLLAKSFLRCIQHGGEARDIPIPAGDDFLSLPLAPASAGS